MATTADILRTVARGPLDPDELAMAAWMRHSGPPPTGEGLVEFVDFFILEWVDADGLTAVDRAVDAGRVDPAAARLGREVRTALWVVDGWEGETVLLRDLATEADMAVHAPGAQRDLPARTVLRARVVPEVSREDRFVFSGSPDLYDGLGVIARMDLLRAWQETPEPDLHARLAALRAAFTQQREEHAAFLVHFGVEELVFDSADALSGALARFVSFLGNEWRFPSLAGRTRAELHRHERGADPAVVQVQLGESLRGPGRPGVIYDRAYGVHFLPGYGELLDHLAGRAAHPDVLQLYVDEPGLPWLALRTGSPEVRALKPRGRAVPSVLPGFEG